MERYSILPHMETVFDREARRMPAPAEGREAVLVWQREARAKLWELLSLNPFGFPARRAMDTASSAWKWKPSRTCACRFTC